MRINKNTHTGVEVTTTHARTNTHKSTYVADAVLVTLPLGVLKESLKVFFSFFFFLFFFFFFFSLFSFFFSYLLFFRNFFIIYFFSITLHWFIICFVRAAFFSRNPFMIFIFLFFLFL